MTVRDVLDRHAIYVIVEPTLRMPARSLEMPPHMARLPEAKGPCEVGVGLEGWSGAS